ncbi:TetR/AcrR family transcriptional regulator [Amycolatopsis tucumanensis]|uniref:TetR family transcriptional regulator n=1 Tax=Amycolatopsis tucumanensis TaxID=401106 RepID=A0ABP7IXU2_9PSEU|nr:TetR family transcriptional regulator [Amycolatopsis tucumanensis]MCF6423431.1 TetR/AcrR family transcriptional regulator [Amycolatopsis tucumanensis]
MTTTEQSLPLRERKKLRTRQALAETAVAMFTERGFDATTLDELVDAVEVSKRTFFRNFSSKEDVALTAIKQLWETYLAVLTERPPSGPLLGVLKDALLTTLARLDDHWYRQFLPTVRLTEGCAALHAHSLRYCAEVKSEIVRVLGGGPDLELRLLVEVVVGTWNCALAEWSPSGERDLLPVLVNRAFGTLPAALALE